MNTNMGLIGPALNASHASRMKASAYATRPGVPTGHASDPGKLAGVGHGVLATCILVAGFVPQGATAQDDGAPDTDNNVPDVRVEVHRPAELHDGYLFWHRTDEIGADYENYSVLVDNDGRVVHRWETKISGGGVSAYVLPGGSILRMGGSMEDADPSTALVGVPQATIVQIADPQGDVIWEVQPDDVGIDRFHHDMAPMPNGNILILTYTLFSAEEAAAIGWDLEGAAMALSDGIVEVRPNLDDGSSEVVWEWHFHDHIIQDRDPETPNYGVVEDHPERIDAHFPESYAPMNQIRQHLNGIDYNAELDQVVVSSFVYNEIWIIDHSTTVAEAAGSTGGRSGMGGDLLFRHGNPAAYGMGTPDDRLFAWQHDPNWIDVGLPGAGNLLIFNNNTQAGPGVGGMGIGPGSDGMGMGATGAMGLGGMSLGAMGVGGMGLGAMGLGTTGATGAGALQAQRALQGVSNVHELRLRPAENGAYPREPGEPFAAEQVWFWEDPGFFAPFQGGARRLPNGNTLLTDTVNAYAREINADGDTVAEYFGSAPSYKTFKYSREQVAELL